ncbi:hypothetical protein BDA99DRAFT_496696 [Phascolomyces articulosus]|uniref:F-box domain-containing protein n=1 Tax=Phascolomyces articulosus TaxID=60185 RepID=A0AAD5KME0_9FUNG|nr:hypothetical protein BDA99DRAFT_496696 [Phascolomyces articulosus]
MEFPPASPKRKLSYNSDELDWKDEMEHVINQAQEYAEDNDLDKAWELASTVIENNPHSMEAFLVRGELYKRQGHYNIAMNIFDQGAKSMEREEEKQILREKYQALSNHVLQVKKNEKDPIKLLPSEVSIMIFEYFGIGEWTIFTCTFVSKIWRKFVLTLCSSGWESARWDGSGSTSPAFIMLEQVASRVTSIESFNQMSKNTKEKYRAILNNANLDKVRKLKTDTINMDVLLPKVGSNLTSLILAIDYNPPKSFQLLDVEQILSDCPNIIHLGFDSATTRPENEDRKDYQYSPHIIKPFSGTTKITYSNLQTFIVRGHPLDDTIAGVIFQRSPNLRVFGTTVTSTRSGRRDHRNVIRTTMEKLELYSLSHLKSLLILPNETDNLDSLIEKIINEQYHHQNSHMTTTTGLKQIVIAPGKGSELNYLVPFLTQSRKTLEILTFDLNDYLDICDDEYETQTSMCVARWHDLFSNIPHLFTKLRTLEYKRQYVRTFDFDDIFVELIKRTPELESISLEGIGLLSNSIINALRDLHHLQKLKLERCSLSTKLHSWFKHYASSKNEELSPLKHIELINCKGFKHIKIWKPLSDFRGLDFVKITDCKMKRKEVQQFVYRYCQHSDVRSICLKDLEFVSDDEVKKLLKHRGDIELDYDDDFRMYNTYEYPYGWVEFKDDFVLEGYDENIGRYRLI